MFLSFAANSINFDNNLSTIFIIKPILYCFLILKSVYFYHICLNIYSITGIHCHFI